MSVVRHGLLSFMMMVALVGGTAEAEDLEKGKFGAKAVRGQLRTLPLQPARPAKDRFSWTLSHFLQQHYTSSSSSAEALTAFLQSADAGGFAAYRRQVATTGHEYIGASATFDCAGASPLGISLWKPSGHWSVSAAIG